MNPLDVKRVSVNFGGLRALDNVSLALAPGERRAIIGTNGAGKTTLFNVVSGRIRPSAGRVSLFGRDVTRLPAHRRVSFGLGRTFQITNLFPALSLLDNMIIAVLAPRPARFTFYRPLSHDPEILGAARDLLQQWRLWDYRDAPVRNLSYGVQRQIEIVLVLAGNPKILLLDEPLAGLSGAETERVIAVVANVSRDICVLLIEHDLSAVYRVADRITAMDRGRIVAEGTAEEIRREVERDGFYGRRAAAAGEA